MAIITKTIGTGGDYSTIQAWANDLDNASFYNSGDTAIGNIIENKNFDEQVTISLGGTRGLARRTLTVDSSVRHNGLAGTGARIVRTTSPSTAIIFIQNPIPTTISWLEVSGGGANWDNGIFYNSTTNGVSSSHLVQACLVHHIGTTTGSTNNVSGVACNSDARFIAMNNAIYRIRSAATNTNTVTGIFVGASGTTSVNIFNNTVYAIIQDGGTGAKRGIFFNTTNSARQCKNNAVGAMSLGTGTGTGTCFLGTGSATLANNASSDSTATGTGAITSLNVNTAWNNVTNNSEDFRLGASSILFQTGADLDSAPTDVNLDITGFNRTGSTWSISAYQQKAPTAIAVASPYTLKIFQRDANGKADIPITGTYTGTPTSIEASFNGGSYATIVASPSGGTYSGTLTNQNAGQGTLTVRFTNDTSINISVNNILIGDIFVVAGQSNAEGRGTNNQSYSNASLNAVVFRKNSSQWGNLTDPSGSGVLAAGSAWPLLATQLLADLNVPVGFITTADGGTGLVNPTDWSKSAGGASYTACIATINTASVNAVKAVLWYQGETDAGNGTARTTYSNALTTLASDFSTDIPGNPVLVAGQTGPAGGAVGATTQHLDAIRLAQSDDWGISTQAGPVMYDILGDGLHFISNTDLTTFAHRWWIVLKGIFYGGSFSRGPKLISVKCNNKQIIVKFDKTLKTGLTFSTSAWTVTDGSAITINSIEYHPTDTNALIITVNTKLSQFATISLGSGETATGQVIPTSVSVNIPTGGTNTLPAETFVNYSIVNPKLLGILGIGP